MHMTSTSTLSSSSSSSLGVPKVPELACERCGDRFHLVRFLHLHIRQVHDRLPAHHCPHCRSPFGRVQDVDDHIRQIHNDRRTYACDQCTSSYQSATVLAIHVAEAHGVRRRRSQLSIANLSQVVRRCSMCDFHTVHDDAFVSHLRQTHSVQVMPGVAMDNGPYQAAERRTVGFLPGSC